MPLASVLFCNHVQKIQQSYPETTFTWIVFKTIVGRNVNGTFFIDGNLTSDIYLNLLHHHVILSLVTLYSDRRYFWVQQDDSPPHYGLQIKDHLNETFLNKCIG